MIVIVDYRCNKLPLCDKMNPFEFIDTQTDTKRQSNNEALSCLSRCANETCFHIKQFFNSTSS